MGLEVKATKHEAPLQKHSKQQWVGERQQQLPAGPRGQGRNQGDRRLLKV